VKSLLVANRGEIAVRVIRTAQDMGIRTIAIFSELDRDARHVDIADEAWNVGGAPASESYLNRETILRVAHESGAEAIHPGYGFLSENAGFARAVETAGIIWVGPSGDAIEAMGDKITSRRNAEKFGVPTVPGITDPVTTVDEVLAVEPDGVFYSNGPGDPAATNVVDHRMPIEDLQQPVVADQLQLLGRDGPAEVGMIDVRDAARLPDGIDVSLHDVQDGRASLRRDALSEVQAVDVNRLVAELVGHFLAPHDQEPVVGAVKRLQRLDGGQEVVIGQNDEVIAVLAIPPHDVVRRGVAVAVEGVGMRVALVPATRGLDALCGGLLGASGRRGPTAQHERRGHCANTWQQFHVNVR